MVSPFDVTRLRRLRARHQQPKKRLFWSADSSVYPVRFLSRRCKLKWMILIKSTILNQGGAAIKSKWIGGWRHKADSFKPLNGRSSICVPRARCCSACFAAAAARSDSIRRLLKPIPGSSRDFCRGQCDGLPHRADFALPGHPYMWWIALIFTPVLRYRCRAYHRANCEELQSA
jgi:hypothetical protein